MPTPEEESFSRFIVSKLERRYSITFQRAGDQRYTELDPPKDPFTDAINGNLEEGKDYELLHDGQFAWTSADNRKNGDSLCNYSITGYTYIIYRRFFRNELGAINNMVQQVTLKNYKIKIFCQYLLGMQAG